MKKIFCLVPVLWVCLSSLANTTMSTMATRQNYWRWRNDDGSETSATWKDVQLSPVTYTSTSGGVIRLRIELINVSSGYNQNTGTFNAPLSVPAVDTLQYSVSPADASSWQNIGSDPGKAFMMAASSAFVAQGDSTTPQITGTANTFRKGLLMVSNDVFVGGTMPVSSRTEVEWAIRGTGSMLAGTKYYFRQRGTTTSYPSNYNSYPSLTTASLAPLPVKLVRFSVVKEGSKVRIEWTTASEGNSDHFEILRSADAQSWKAMAQVPSQGNTTASTAYSAYDDQPLPNLTYYRLKQVDKDGRFSLSEIKGLRIFTDAVVSVWPNPASSQINFSLQQPETKVSATLQDAAGRTILKETFSNLPAGAVSKLALAQKPATGVYVLKLEANGFSQTRKIIIQ